MKKSRIIFSLLVTIIAALSTMTANAQQRALLNWQNGEPYNSFLYNDVDSITYSRVGLDNRTYPNVVVQEVWKRDSVYRIPINSIDSVTLKAPKTEFNDSIFHIRDFHYPYVLEVTDSTISFDASIPVDSLPALRQIVVSDRVYQEPFMRGFSGRVTSIVRSGNLIRIEFEKVELKDIFKTLYYIGKAVTSSEDSTLTRMKRGIIDIIDEQDVVPIPYHIRPFNISKNGSTLSVNIDPEMTIEYLIYIGIGEKDRFRCVFDNTWNCTFGFDWDFDKSFSLDYYPDFSSQSFPIAVIIPPAITLNAFINLGAYLDFSASANLGFSIPVTLHSQVGFDTEITEENPNHLWHTFDKPVFHFDQINGHADLSASLSFGLALEAGLCITDEDLLSANLTLKTGPRFSGSINFDTNLSDGWSWYNLRNSHITHEPLTSSLSFGVNVAGLYQNDWPIAELDLSGIYPPRTRWLFPDFSKPYLPGLSSGVLGYDLTALTTDINRDVIFKIRPGIGLYQDNQLKYTYFSKKEYQNSDEWHATDLQMKLKNYPVGDYTAKPIFKIFNRYTIPVDSIANVTIPNPMDVSHSSVTLNVGETKTISISNGWGDYNIYNNDPSVCNASLSGRTISITGRKAGSATITVEDIRSKDKIIIPVTVTSPGVPVITVTPSRGDFGLVEMNSVNTKDFTISRTNVTGNLSISLTGDTVFKILSSNNNGFKIQFKPYKASTFRGTVTITASDGTKCTVPLTGESCAITGKDEVNFGDVQVGSNLTKIRKLTGYRCPDAITLVSKTGTKNYEFTVTPTSLPAAGDTLYLTFAPTVTGNAEAVLTFESGPATKTVTLKGNGVATPVRTFTPDSIKFGNVAQGDTTSALLTIKGSNLTGPLTLRCTNTTRFSIEGVEEITLTPTNGAVNKQVRVTYHPTTAGGNGAYIFITGGGVTKRDTVKLHGVCVIPEINFVPSDTIKFGTVVKGYSKTKTLKITGANLTGPLTVRSTNHVFTVNGKSQITLSPNKGSVNATVTVKYEPDKVQTNGGYVIISGGGIQQKKIGLKGKCEAGYITVNPGTLEFGDSIAPGKSVSRSFTATTNVPGALSSSYTETVGGEFTVPSTIGAGSNTVTFKSSEAGSYSGVINIQDPISGARAQVMMKAKVVPQILVDTESWQAGTVVKNYTATKTVNVTTKGFTSAMLLEIASSSNQFKVSKSTLGASGGSFVITYKPTAVGSHSATITISSVGPGGQVNKTINVSGKCEAGYITVNPGTLEFGDSIAPGKSVSRSFTVTTNVPGALSSSYTETVGGEFTVPSSIGAGTNTVTFKSSEVGSYSGVINIQDPISGARAQVMMKAKVVPQILVNTESWSAGTVVKNYTATKTVNVTTKGFTSAMFLEIASSSNQFKVSKSTLGASGGSFVITYKPTAVGSHSATITISSVGPGGQVNKTINVSGKCEDGYITVNPGTLEFGNNIAPGKSVSKSFTVTTNVPGALSSSYTETVGGEFTVPSSIGAGTNTVTFKSSEAGSYSGVINIQDPISGARAQVKMNAKVVAPTPTITVNPSSLSFGSTPINSSSQEMFTVTGSNLTGNLYLLPKSNVYSVSPSTISPDANGAVNQEVIVTFSPIIAKIYTSSVTVSGGGATTKTVSLTGRGIEETVY